MALIQLRGVSKRYPNGVLALQPTDLEFSAGEVTAVLGPSGAGKSTLLRCINGLETATSGEVRVGDLLVTPKSLRQVRREVAMVFQHFNLVPRLSAMTNVLVGRLGRRGILSSLLYAFPPEDHELAAAALKRVGLAQKAWDRVDRLSGGQQQRVGIARAVVQQPRAVLADEPVASLDPATSREILSLLVEISREQGIACVVNLHQVDLALEFADRVVGLKGGQVVVDGPASSFRVPDFDSLYGNSGALAEVRA